jgi:hypothetical protein
MPQSAGVASFFSSDTGFLDDLLDRAASKLQLSPSEYELAENRYEGVGDWLASEQSGIAHLAPSIYPQGSVRIGTTVQPIGRDEFDVDLVCEFDCDWTEIENPLDLLYAVEHCLRRNGNYADLVVRKNRCVRLNYAGEFHLDILPACPVEDASDDRIRVPDQETSGWTDSNPKGYAKWFERQVGMWEALEFREQESLPDREDADEKAPLKRAVQLLKRARDVAYKTRDDLTGEPPISIVLTTIAGHLYTGQNSVFEALSDILDKTTDAVEQARQPGNGGRLSVLNPAKKSEEFLEFREAASTDGRLVVLNPTNENEDFSERWDDDRESYEDFVGWVKSLDRMWSNLRSVDDIPEAKERLSKLFGEDLTNEVIEEQAESIRSAQDSGDLSVGASGAVSAQESSGGSSGSRVRKNTFYGGYHGG